MNPALANQAQHDVRPADDASFRLMVDTVRDHAFIMLDIQGNIVSWNAGAKAITGHDPEEMIGRHFSAMYPAEAEPGAPETELVNAIREGRLELEGWRRRKDGSTFWAKVVITPLFDANRHVVGFTKAMRDLTERRRFEESLRHSEARFRALVEGVREYAIVMLDTSGDVATWNAGAAQILGYDANEIIGQHCSRFMVTEGPPQERARRELELAAIEGRFQDETLRVRKNGEQFWANVVITALRDSSGALIGFSQITRDLTERKRHEAELRSSEERFRLLVENVIDYAIVTLDDDGIVTSWNHGAERMNGYAAGEIIGRHFSRLYPPEDIRANKPWKHLQTARDRGRVYDESWRMRQDGTQYWANNVVARLPGPADGPRTFYMVIQDLTQRRHAETLADTAQRMHEFIAMLAHELRNPLAPIRNAVALMARHGMPDPLMESMRQTIDRQSLGLARIVDELLDVNRVARGQLTIEKQVVDLRDIIARAVETCRPLIDAHAHRLHIGIADRPIECFGDPLRLTQVVVNILNNAAKYTPDEGDIWLTALQIAGRAEIRVRDNGRGIERDSIDRVFDLFMQVDPARGSALGGLGVGLALARRIVELHGGNVHAVSAGLGKGSEFIVRLPITQAARTAPIPAGDQPAHFRPLRILVVDDNQDAANSLMMLLKTLGHDVRAMYDGPSAIAAAQEQLPEVVLLDIGMPVMNGYDVARALRAGHTGLVLVAVTGWGHEAARRQAIAAGFDHHVVKPVLESTLIELLARVAAEREASK
jgi:PAS domain S-box-containing protein